MGWSKFFPIGLSSQWLFLVPLKGGMDYIIPQLAVYTTYILPSGGLYNPYHLLGEPEAAIDLGLVLWNWKLGFPNKKIQQKQEVLGFPAFFGCFIISKRPSPPTPRKKYTLKTNEYVSPWKLIWKMKFSPLKWALFGGHLFIFGGVHTS